MSVAIVNVVVPASGDGPASSITNIVGEKTVELAGRFVGSYVLLGSQDDVHFVPVLFFDSDGEESIKQSLPFALKSVKIRSLATSLTPIAVNVSGVSLPGDNQFTTVGTVVIGASGPQAAVNLDVVFPPTGVERDICFLCTGNFDGLVTVEGSMDGISYNAIGGFRSYVQPASLLGGSSTIEFSPLVTSNLVHYVRLSVAGVVKSPVVVTMGGSIPTVLVGAPKLVEVTFKQSGLAFDTEVILDEEPVNLTDLPIGSSISVQLNIAAQVIPAGTATFKIYVGSITPGDTTGGTLRATTTTASSTEVVLSSTGVVFANPGGPCLVQLTGMSSAPGVQAAESSATVVIG